MWRVGAQCQRNWLWQGARCGDTTGIDQLVAGLGSPFQSFARGYILKIFMPEITGDLHIRTNEADTAVPFLLIDDQKLLLIPDIICYNWNQVPSVAKAIFKLFVLDFKCHSFTKLRVSGKPSQGGYLLFEKIEKKKKPKNQKNRKAV